MTSMIISAAVSHKSIVVPLQRLWYGLVKPCTIKTLQPKCKLLLLSSIQNLTRVKLLQF